MGPSQNRGNTKRKGRKNIPSVRDCKSTQKEVFHFSSDDTRSTFPLQLKFDFSLNLVIFYKKFLIFFSGKKIFKKNWRKFIELFLLRALSFFSFLLQVCDDFSHNKKTAKTEKLSKEKVFLKNKDELLIVQRIKNERKRELSRLFFETPNSGMGSL